MPDVECIPIDTRAQRVKAAFNDPASAPDVMEYGNTDAAGYVKDGGLLDVTKEFGEWGEAKDTDPTAKQSVTVDGKLYGAPFHVGVRALYYRTDVFEELGLSVPRTMDELASTAREIRAAKPELYGLVVGGAYTYGAMPFVWANGGELANGKSGSYASGIDSAQARKGIKAYTSLFGDDNCPAAKCAGMGGNDTISAFAAGKAGMAIGGDFSHTAVEAGKAKGKYAVVPLRGVKSGSIAPAFGRSFSRSSCRVSWPPACFRSSPPGTTSCSPSRSSSATRRSRPCRWPSSSSASPTTRTGAESWPPPRS